MTGRVRPKKATKKRTKPTPKQQKQKQQKQTRMQRRASTSDRKLLPTSTGNAFQPVRLYFRCTRSDVAAELAQLECIVEESTDRLRWLYCAETRTLRFGPLLHDPNQAPITLGYILVSEAEMSLEVEAPEHALVGAKFFGSRLGDGIVLTGGRIVNRYFDSREPRRKEELMGLLDTDVTAVPTYREVKSKARALLEGSPIEHPLVEELVFHPEDGTRDFRHLAFVFRMRTMYAYQRWQGKDFGLQTLVDALEG